MSGNTGNITYKDIYPGIDLEFFTSKEHGYKYNFVIHPGEISMIYDSGLKDLNSIALQQGKS